ncbi:amino acid adenylation domain-containing protein [Aerosakkonema sp. BLCC-F183]|uniref:amino acid adenylation domain-containing protein n=1 Tax=Aerosakkonema sp. BLCC-F183 TaxID=3342834 RepID=UPI0035B89F49
MTDPDNDSAKLPVGCSTFADILRYWALHQPQQRAFTFLQEVEGEETSLTYQEFDRRSRAIASQLQSLGLSGERALLLYPPGLDYLAAFFGCLYAGVVAVPAYPPRNKRNTPRIKAIASDAQAAIALTTSAIESKVKSLLEEEIGTKALQWLTTDNLDPNIEDYWQKPFIEANTLAFLQYTSGSTGEPKGVMVSHGNLLHNAAVTYRLMEHSPNSKFVSWLPAYHDMGLIGGILQPLYGGFPCILMSPTSFLQRPYRWLQAISHYRGTTSGGPNFAYELCIEKITPEQRQTLDLSSWSVAFNGAEPVRHDTLERFSATFAECGFRREAFYPCYGMAEATLMVSGGIKRFSPTIKSVRSSALECDRAIEVEGENEDIRTFVSCGQSIPDQQIAIVHPEKLTRCLPDEVGEIWVSGPSVAQGYWHRTQETEENFCAYLTDCRQDACTTGPFLRTGDLGFWQNGELFVTGRTKDLIIIRGRNLYPTDIELSAERSHPELRSSSGAAFAVEIGNEEQLVVVQELQFRSKANVAEVIAAIRKAVSEEHEVQVYAVVLIKAGSIPKTSSGKIQRRACRSEFLAGKLDVLGSSILNCGEKGEDATRLNREAILTIAVNDRQSILESYLQSQVDRVLGIAPASADKQQPLSSFGLDSLKVFELKNRIEGDFQVAISVADFFEDASISVLATQILAQITAGETKSLVPITPIGNIATEYPLSFAQQRLWFINKLEPNSAAYNIAIAVYLTGRINEAALSQSLQEIIKRHAVLRTSFKAMDGQPMQVIHPEIDWQLENWKNFSKSSIQDYLIESAQQPFDLDRGGLLRAKLVRLGEEENILFLVMHHIVSDGWSIGIFIREIVALYEAFSSGKPSPLAELPIQYADFAYWQQQQQVEVFQTQLAYWKQQLAGNLPVLNLPTDRARSPVTTFRGAKQTLAFPKVVRQAILELSQQEGATLFMTLLAAFKTLLYRYTDREDLLVGSPIANRNRREIEGLIGCFVNTLVLRSNLGGNPSFRELLRRVRKVALEAYAHQDLPFEKLVELLHPERDLSHTPLFQVMFALQNFPLPAQQIPGLSWRVEEIDNKTAKFDLTLFVEDTGGELIGTVEYNTDLFNPDTMTRMLGHFSTLLSGIVENPDRAISDLPLLTEAERQQILVNWNDTKTELPPNVCIHKLFEAQVERTPDAIAVVCQDEKLTYRELNERANQLAHYLQNLGVKPEVLVGICVERSLEMLVGLLGILKAGGAYVPLDPGYPKERLAFMLEDAQAPILLTQQRLLEIIPSHSGMVVSLDTNWQDIAQESSDNPVSNVCGENLAYVIYTSGSTGKPKGTLIHHRGLVNYLSWCTKAYSVEQGEGAAVHSSISFDMTITGLFSPLLVGRKVELLPEDKGIVTLATTLRNKSNFSLIKITPAQLELLSHQLLPEEVARKTRAFIIGGENLLAESIAFWQENASDTMLINEYGPTETVVGCCIYQAKDKLSGSVPIGRPIANTQLYILDRNLQPVPVGITGELYIGGAGVARGYLHRPELTAERFIANPFIAGERLYKTGDLARYRADGIIEYFGRIDHQVKIRGFRIELSEIEAVLSQHCKVRECAVLAKCDRLIAYAVLHPGETLIISELRTYLAEKLPEYMVPSALVTLDEMPLTVNGKVDRQALPAPESLRPELEVAYVSPQTELEQIIATIWQEVLRLEKVGIYDNFFDLGGHSLLIVKVHSRLQAKLEKNISMVEMFKYPTIESLAKHLSPQREEKPIFQEISDLAQKQRLALSRQKQLMKQVRWGNE